tara:strand:+ start:65 stop:307 length:243 start_codon:yes stop_codon:yes gene_type:complete
MKIGGFSFGNKGDFEVGELVTWAKIQKKYSGVVEGLYIKHQGGREVAFATVFEFSKQEKHEVLCLNLKKLHKTVVNEVEN